MDRRFWLGLLGVALFLALAVAGIAATSGDTPLPCCCAQ